VPTALPTLQELGGCVFTKPANKHGYGAKFVNGKQVKTHRLVYQQTYGEIPKGMEVDHICHNVAVAHEMCLGGKYCIHRSCINPEHLRLVTHQENQLEGLAGLRNRKKCKNGHVLEEVGIVTRTRPNGKTGQLCAECLRINRINGARRFRQKQKAGK
jgi:hypothetical protein